MSGAHENVLCYAVIILVRNFLDFVDEVESRGMKTSLWILLLVGLQVSLAQKTPIVASGPAVGTRVPEFAATDQSSHLQTLASISGPKGSFLVFFRSADW